MLETNECARQVGDLSAFLSVADERSPAAAAWRSNGRSVRVGIVPLFQVYPVFVPLFSLHRSFPGFIGLLGVLPVGMLARILIWFLFAHGIARQRAERNCSSTGPDRS